MTKHFSRSSFFIFSKDLNYGKSLFGGKLMSEIDCEAAKVARSMIYHTGADNAVTASVERIDFKAPAHEGDEIMLEADAVKIGTKSMDIEVTCSIKRGSDRNEWIEICRAHLVFVSMKNGKSYKHGLTQEELK